MTRLPIETELPHICATLSKEGRALLIAPPGAGKTTRVPLALAGLLPGFAGLPGKIILLEPRRLAARLAAERMADTLAERPGQRIGLSTRIDRRISAGTQVEVMTEGLFIRRLVEDPELTGVSAILFDEIHERSLNVDLAMSLSLEVQDALRPDLKLLAMSATLETETMAETLQAPVIEAKGRAYPVKTHYLGRTQAPISAQMVSAIERAMRETSGSILAFLPGAADIRRVAEDLCPGPDTVIAPLYGALPPEQQDRAIAPARPGQRKIVLATNIAESSLTIEGVDVVVDCGLTRISVERAGQTSKTLQTVRASRASVDQRQGRAGRLRPGTCYRLWDEAETRGLNRAPEPEITRSDLSGLLLTLSVWGETDPFRLKWLTPPSTGSIEAARSALNKLGALDHEGGLTAKGRRMAELPLDPALAALIASADTPGEAALAAQLAVIISEPGLGGQSSDLGERLRKFNSDRSQRAQILKRQAASWTGQARPSGHISDLLIRAWPHRLARRRAEGQSTYLLASGNAGSVDPASSLASEEWLVVADMMGSARQGRITLAVPAEARTILTEDRIETEEQVHFDPETGKIRARKISHIGAIPIAEQPLSVASPERANQAYLKHVSEAGFSNPAQSHEVQLYIARTSRLRSLLGAVWPDESVYGIMSTADQWLAPFLSDGSFKEPTAGQIAQALKTRLDPSLSHRFDSLAPLSLVLPAGRRARIDWIDDRAPLIACKVQELYGQTDRLTVCEGRLDVTFELLSPGGKPVATTRDLPAFWKNGYRDMVRDMRGRYPKHDWPDAPEQARPHMGISKARLKQIGSG